MTLKTVSIDILIPVYNVSAYIEACMASILEQIEEHVHVYLMDDASTDDSRAVIEQYAALDRVTVLDAPHNRGLSGTRNALLAHATADYVWFIDSDDAMLPGAYACVVEYLARQQVDVLIGDYLVWQASNKPSYKRKRSFIGRAHVVYNNDERQFLNNIIKNNSNHVWNKVYKRTLIEATPFKQGKKFEDIYFMTDISSNVATFAYCGEPLIAYRMREGSIVNSLNQAYVDDYLSAFIHRVDKWRALQDAAANHQGATHPDVAARDYLLYKSVNRYIGLINKLANHQQQELLDYTHNNYHETFMGYAAAITHGLGWLRKQKINYKLTKLDKILSHQGIV